MTNWEQNENIDDDSLSQHGFVAHNDGTVKWRFSFKMFSWYSFKISPVDGGKKIKFVHTEMGPCSLSKLERAFVANWQEIENALGEHRASNFRLSIIRSAKQQPKTPPSSFNKLN